MQPAAGEAPHMDEPAERQQQEMPDDVFNDWRTARSGCGDSRDARLKLDAAVAKLARRPDRGAAAWEPSEGAPVPGRRRRWRRPHLFARLF